MSRSLREGAALLLGFPRLRGDEPYIGAANIVIAWFSPPTRG